MSSPLTTIEVHTSPWDAHVARAMLEANGFRVFLANEHHVAANWAYSHALGGVKVQVPAVVAQQAMELLQLRDSGVLEESLFMELGISDLAAGGIQKGSMLQVVFAFATLLLCSVIFPPRRDRPRVSEDSAAT